jgi:hypothetical protein
MRRINRLRPRKPCLRKLHRRPRLNSAKDHSEEGRGEESTGLKIASIAFKTAQSRTAGPSLLRASAAFDLDKAHSGSSPAFPMLSAPILITGRERLSIRTGSTESWRLHVKCGVHVIQILLARLGLVWQQRRQIACSRLATRCYCTGGSSEPRLVRVRP